MFSQDKGFFSVDYHYLRPKDDEYGRLIGTSLDEFKNHVNFFMENFKMINLKNIFDFYYNQILIQNGLSITFDDGLSDHYYAAKILYDNKISGTFFVPSCIFSDKLPPNPTIIHYAIAIHGLKKFLNEYRIILDELNLDILRFDISYDKNLNDIWEVISNIKNIFKYKLDQTVARKILLIIFERLLVTTHNDIISHMHLTHEQIKEMLEMGHYVGAHTHTHISIPPTIDTNYIEKELVFPTTIFKKIFNQKMYSFSYPYGDPNDCLSSKDLMNHTNQYKLAFTVENKFNTLITSPLELGRYEVQRSDTITTLNHKLHKILTKYHEGSNIYK
jgi:peptidoglycan/xylan/chitin deacetylase (PgdA/CDA1 family)